MKRLFLLPALGLLGAFLVACGGSVSDAPGDGGATDAGIDTGTTTIDGGGVDTAEPPPTFDTGTRPDSTLPPADTGPVTCNDLANIGGVIDETRIAAPMPTLAGAASIASGTYVLVKNELYTGTGGAAGKTGKTLRETLLITPGVVQAVISQNGGGDKDSSLSYTITGSLLNVAGTCGDATATVPDFMFDASPTTLRIGLTMSGTSFLLTFEKK